VDLVLATRTKLQRDAFGRAIAKTAADVFAADDQILTVIDAGRAGSTSRCFRISSSVSRTARS